MQSTTKLKQIGSTGDLSPTRGKKSVQLKLAACGLRVEPRKMRKDTQVWAHDVGAEAEINRYRVEQYNVIIDVLGGYSKHPQKSVRKLLGARARGVLERIQRSVISNTLNIARIFKINT